MNCKPNQLARVISTPSTERCKIADRIIRVTSLQGTTLNGRPAWHYEGPKIVCGCGCEAEIDGFGDNILRPINNPGDDAVDEMVRLVGSAPRVAGKDRVEA